MHEKASLPQGSPQDPEHRPTVGSKEEVLSYQRGTPVHEVSMWHEVEDFARVGRLVAHTR